MGLDPHYHGSSYREGIKGGANAEAKILKQKQERQETIGNLN